MGGVVRKATPGGGSSTLISICGANVWTAGMGPLNTPQSFGGEMTGKNYRIDGAAEFYGIPVEELRAALDFENRTAEEIDQILTDAMMNAYKSMDFNDRHGEGRNGRIGEVVLQMLRDM